MLGVDEPGADVTIGGHKQRIQQSPVGTNFHDINLLGTDFCNEHRIQKWEDYPKGRTVLYFDGEWGPGSWKYLSCSSAFMKGGK